MEQEGILRHTPGWGRTPAIIRSAEVSGPHRQLSKHSVVRACRRPPQSTDRRAEIRPRSISRIERGCSEHIRRKCSVPLWQIAPYRHSHHVCWSTKATGQGGRVRSSPRPPGNEPTSAHAHVRSGAQAREEPHNVPHLPRHRHVQLTHQAKATSNCGQVVTRAGDSKSHNETHIVLHLRRH